MGRRGVDRSDTVFWRHPAPPKQQEHGAAVPPTKNSQHPWTHLVGLQRQQQHAPRDAAAAACFDVRGPDDQIAHRDRSNRPHENQPAPPGPLATPLLMSGRRSNVPGVALGLVQWRRDGGRVEARAIDRSIASPDAAADAMAAASRGRSVPGPHLSMDWVVGRVFG